MTTTLPPSVLTRSRRHCSVSHSLSPALLSIKMGGDGTLEQSFPPSSPNSLSSDPYVSPSTSLLSAPQHDASPLPPLPSSPGGVQQQ
ncbi:hypothetical protein CF326_g7129 [Tilletia indica]|nr:hypothetical protein CF326_g7129 [Tilletia indica]